MASSKFYVDIELNGQQLKNVALDTYEYVVGVGDQHPTAYEGRLYYNSTDQSAYYYNGIEWIEISYSKTLSNYTSTTEVGAITNGQVIMAGTTFDDFVKLLLLKIYNPTFVAPSASLVATGLSANVEVGTIGNITLTATLNRGSINGNIVGGIWNPSTFQNYRSGIANNYTINGSDLNLTNVLVLNNTQIISGANTWSTVIDYDAGSQPLNSNGDNYSTPLNAGSVSSNATITGQRKYFYGIDSVNNSVYTLSSQVRALPNSTLNPINGTSFTITITANSNARMVVFAYPATPLRNVTSVLYQELSNDDITANFSQTLINVEGANGYTSTSYKVYTYIPVEPFSNTTDLHYIVTI